MPVHRIPDTLPAAEVLAGKYLCHAPEPGPASGHPAAAHRHRNLMPTKEVTETQLLRLIGNTALQVDVTLLTTASYRPPTPTRVIWRLHQTFHQVREEKFDG